MNSHERIKFLKSPNQMKSEAYRQNQVNNSPILKVKIYHSMQNLPPHPTIMCDPMTQWTHRWAFIWTQSIYSSAWQWSWQGTTESNFPPDKNLFIAQKNCVLSEFYLFVVFKVTFSSWKYLINMHVLLNKNLQKMSVKVS
jgi:hypothetical protein